MELKKSTGTGAKKLFTGIASMKVIGINPTSEELAELLGYEPKSDAEKIKYEGKTEKGDDYVDINFWLEADTPEKQKFNARFRLVNKPVVSENTGKSQWVNQSATSTWIDNEKNLQVWFTEFRDKNGNLITKDEDGELTGKKVIRQAIQGEANLYNFLRAWFGNVNFFSERTNTLIDINELFRDVESFVDKKYRSQYRVGNKNMITNVVAMAYVHISEKNGETKMFQNVYGDYLGQWQMKKVNFSLSTGNWDDKGLKKWKEQLEGKYGCDGAFTISSLQPFDPNNYQQATDEVMTSTTSDDIDY
ncbi:MAG: hypothetical protein RLZZ196_1813 [Bacteroidota bacterium]|jgi:hypothetical protein